ncbi:MULTISPECIES: hypothetical protein [Methylobacterium]|jgi:hypothetical protein|uniref:hypothetical protein n=1 Tax=Methylobacterium TaxID=407 RepID=UPI0006F44E1A|nr:MULTISPECIES: hypothetical protein [Methylobacterium]MCI9881830.1 hypothetical protein [Methylobacterium goesingense]TXN38917.1 hypothetical protein FV225_11880 [Methylobacterium sp. WL93]TXN47591.1 hypothetical protein FV227_21370 [Methylobacterium sp. WL119]TXN67719.1 hypothetical protein FV232_11335 [Methylobacterium sp. WL30]
MSEKPPMGVLHHLPPRKPLADMEDFRRDVGETIAAQFREQNEILRAERGEHLARVREQDERLQRQGELIERLTRGVELLVTEMHGVRTGKAEEAFARVGGEGAAPDLPTVSAESAVVYICTAGSIGRKLDFRASEIGTLLGAKGLRWAGNGAYQELGREVGPNHTKFWHRDVPARLRRVLDENNPARHGITDRSVLAIFRKWSARRTGGPDLLDSIEALKA